MSEGINLFKSNLYRIKKGDINPCLIAESIKDFMVTDTDIFIQKSADGNDMIQRAGLSNYNNWKTLVKAPVISNINICDGKLYYSTSFTQSTTNRQDLRTFEIEEL